MRNRNAIVPMSLFGVAVVALAVAIGLLATHAGAENVDPNNDMSQYAYGENTGWINAEPANCANCGVQVNATDVTGRMWGENAGWINMSCKNNYGAICTGSPGGSWGVAKSSAGKLSGYAWGENVGWINMSCTNDYGASCTGSPGGTWGVSIATNGVFTGRAWGENSGWISFSGATPVVYQVQTDADFDFDGVKDATDNCPNWSNASQALPSWSVPAGDSDCDGFPDTVAAGGKAPESFIGTVANQQCALTAGANNEPLPDAWPVDSNDDRLAGGQDILAYGPAFNKHAPGPPYSVRLDLTGDGLVGGQDVLKFGPFFNKHCS